MIQRPCMMCGTILEADDLDAYGKVGLAHLRAEHPELPYGDMAVRNTYEGEARMTGGAERPYQGHGLAPQLLARVLADAAARGAEAVEAYPSNPGVGTQPNFRGPRKMYEAAGFQEVKIRTFDTVVRRPV